MNVVERFMAFQSHFFRQNHFNYFAICYLNYTAILDLPFCLRLLITLLPVWVLILTLKPETRFLFLLVPPNVLLVMRCALFKDLFIYYLIYQFTRQTCSKIQHTQILVLLQEIEHKHETETFRPLVD